MARSVPSEAPYNLDYTALASVDVESRDCGDSKSEVRRRQSQIALASRYNGVRADQSFAWAAVSARQLDDVSEFVVNLWEPGNKQKSPLVQSTRAFASYMVQELGICETAMLASLVYMVRLSDVFAEKGLSTVNCSKQLFVACLLTATKYLYDIPQTNASWARVCQLDPSHINSMELELLEALSFHVGVSAREMDGARLYSKRRISAPTRACDNSVYVPTTTRREFPVSPMYQPSSSRRSAHRSVSSALESRSNERAEAREARFARDSVLSPNESPRAGSIRDAFSGNGHMSRDIPSPAPDETFRRSYSSGMRTVSFWFVECVYVCEVEAGLDRFCVGEDFNLLSNDMRIVSDEMGIHCGIGAGHKAVSTCVTCNIH
ncbi:hypothetical protein SARC_00886 [Sphaeroforma arctica JP610]|uniref:Cyclin N-terminal domain-containing protein n=1 Tax=Sphaeroforma arctica JP610 TaxID=667725 RepID=A0A0L0GFD6_9EUKA|nr:hypothetical protein SARC_00886 [Sphaeroforma arctica JP610]KNC86993.1 hypothetical protein SARC_00886 [Sphaeroforma arctica JP610]|eukprot:XP_014160895.1 hypothetical protein SARC_00886 [Sphaeroforma arctica JP610]